MPVLRLSMSDAVRGATRGAIGAAVDPCIERRPMLHFAAIHPPFIYHSFAVHSPFNPHSEVTIAWEAGNPVIGGVTCSAVSTCAVIKPPL